MNVYISNVKERFGPFHFASSKKLLVPGNLENYLHEMIPGFRDPTKRPGNGNVNQNLSTNQCQSVSIQIVKAEPVDSSNISKLAPDESIQPLELSNALAKNEMLKAQLEMQKLDIAERNQKIDELTEQLRLKHEEYEAHREAWIANVNDAQICDVCNELTEMHA